MKSSFMIFVIAVASMLVLAAGAMAVSQRLLMAQQEGVNAMGTEKMGPASSGSQQGNEEMSPAVPAPRTGEEMSPARPNSQKGTEEMSPSGSSSHEKYMTPKKPYKAPVENQPSESQPY